MTFLNLLINPFLWFVTFQIFLIFLFFVFIYIKMSKTFSVKYYQKSKERLKKEDREEEEKKIKQQYGCEYYKNLSKDEKKKLIECYKML